MAQRVYLIPVQQEVIKNLAAAVLAPSEEASAECLRACRERAKAQQGALALSKRYCARLSEEAFASANRSDDYGLFTALRPYLITVRSPEEAVTRTEVLFSAQVADQRIRLLEAEVAALPPELCANTSSTPEDSESESLWEAIHDDLLTAQRMRRASLSGTTYTHEVATKEPFGDGMTVISSDKTEPHVFAGHELAEAYGQLIGATAGRLLGLSLPTWWMGRNFWLGLLLGHHLSPMAAPPFSSIRRLRNDLLALAESPAVLFPELAVPGFEAGFPLMCEAYSSGLYLSPAAVSRWLASFQKTRPALVRLSVLATGYDENSVQLIVSVVHEALIWCGRHGYGVMEGDELVGSLGYR